MVPMKKPNGQPTRKALALKNGGAEMTYAVPGPIRTNISIFYFCRWY